MRKQNVDQIYLAVLSSCAFLVNNMERVCMAVVVEEALVEELF